MSKLIFFVDDDKMIINLLEYTFQSKQEYVIKSFNSGEECLEALHMNPDLVVLDHNLSGLADENMSGMEAMEEIRKVEPDLPVVILTGDGSKELHNEFQNKGATSYLTKDDYFVDFLMEIIGKVLV